MPAASMVNMGSSAPARTGDRRVANHLHACMDFLPSHGGQKKAPLVRGLGSCFGSGKRQRAFSVNLLKATPKSQPSPLPASASDTLPLVMACAFADLMVPAWASAAA